MEGRRMNGSEGGAPTVLPRTAVTVGPVPSVRDRHFVGQVAQGGFSLIEILVCIVLMSTVILSLAVGMLTLVRTSAATSDSQQVQVALGSFTESLLIDPYLPCETLGATPEQRALAYTTAYAARSDEWQPTLAGMTTSIVAVQDSGTPGVEFWEGAASSGAFGASCPPISPTDPTLRDQGAQRLTVRIDYRDVTATAQVVISAEAAP